MAPRTAKNNCTEEKRLTLSASAIFFSSHKKENQRIYNTVVLPAVRVVEDRASGATRRQTDGRSLEPASGLGHQVKGGMGGGLRE